MYSFFYPEDGSRMSFAKEHEFETVEAAVAYWKDRRQIWEEISVSNGEPAFMQPFSGEIVIVRKI